MTGELTGNPPAAHDARDGSLPELLVLCRIPPPVTGMTLVTKEIVERLESAGPVTFYNWSVGTSRRGLGTRLRYAGRIISSIIQLLRRGRAVDKRLYLVSNSQAGLYMTALLVSVAARLGYTLYLHHHVYWYIDRYDRRMAWIDRWIGSRGVHVVHCEKMMQDFSKRYHSKRRFAVVFPSVRPVEVGSSRQWNTSTFRLGLLSNLTMSKGVEPAVETVEALRRAGRPVALTFAGPAHTREARQFVERAVAEHPDFVAYSGTVYGEAKSQFFANIDAFLLPTQSESWGLVLHEALAAGVPVIVNDRGCSRIVAGEGTGLVVSDDKEFVQLAVAQVERWMQNPGEYAAASQAAINQADLLNREGQRTLSDFVEHMFSPIDDQMGLLRPA